MDEQSIKQMYGLQAVRAYSRNLWAYFDAFEDDETWTSEEVKEILIQEHDKYRKEHRASTGASSDDNDTEGNA